MRYGMRLRKSIFIGLMSITLLLSYASVGLADENSKSGHEGMNMGGSTTMETTPKTESTYDSELMNSKPEVDQSSSNSGHVMTPDMDLNMEGMNHNSESNASQDQTNPEGEQSSGEHGAAIGEHGEVSGGHGESSGASDEVNWAIVGGFSGINLLVIASAGILKFMKRF